jgi:hypothetical protein
MDEGKTMETKKWTRVVDPDWATAVFTFTTVLSLAILVESRFYGGGSISVDLLDHTTWSFPLVVLVVVGVYNIPIFTMILAEGSWDYYKIVKARMALQVANGGQRGGTRAERLHWAMTGHLPGERGERMPVGRVNALPVERVSMRVMHASSLLGVRGRRILGLRMATGPGKRRGMATAHMTMRRRPSWRSIRAPKRTVAHLSPRGRSSDRS